MTIVEVILIFLFFLSLLRPNNSPVRKKYVQYQRLKLLENTTLPVEKPGKASFESSVCKIPNKDKSIAKAVKLN